MKQSIIRFVHCPLLTDEKPLALFVGDAVKMFFCEKKHLPELTGVVCEEGSISDAPYRDDWLKVAEIKTAEIKTAEIFTAAVLDNFEKKRLLIDKMAGVCHSSQNTSEEENGISG